MNRGRTYKEGIADEQCGEGKTTGNFFKRYSEKDAGGYEIRKYYHNSSGRKDCSDR